jgi:hypothetical protein
MGHVLNTSTNTAFFENAWVNVSGKVERPDSEVNGYALDY